MFLDRSKYPHRYGNHIEERPGALNFSVVGRDCTQKQREHYAKWDNKHKERKEFAWEIKERYPWLDAVVGGEISIDIYEKYKDKGQIVKDIKGKFEFFGDRLYPGGNDFAIQQEIISQKRKGCKTTPVKTWRDTENLLHSMV
jgi:phosphomannomutase